MSGSGFAIITAIGITGNSGSTINSNCLVTKYLDGILNHYDFDKSRQFEVLSYLDFEVSATGKLYILHGYDETYNSIGFAVINGVLKGFVANTTNETTVNLQTISSEGFEVARSLKVVFTAGIKCEFYVDNVLLGMGLDPEGRKFSPHITLARLHDTPLARLSRFLAGNNLFATEAFPVSEFHLYSSQLTPKGAFHAIEASYPLKGA